MQPSLTYPFNIRSFFTPSETREIGVGIVLWRGYFQSVRPSPTRMLINIDISTGAMYRPGSLLALCLDVLGRPHNNGNPNAQQARSLAPREGLPERERRRVEKFASGVRVSNAYESQEAGGGQGKIRMVRRLSKEGARDLSFKLGDDGPMVTVADFFQTILNRPLAFPDVICAEVCIHNPSIISRLTLVRMRS